MAGEAVVRVKLDGAGAKAELDALFAHGAKGVRVPVSAGQGAGGAGTGGFGGFMGSGFSLGGILGTLGVGATIGRGTLRDAGSITDALTSRMSESFARLLFGDAGPMARGALRAREEVEAQMGLARGLGIASKEDAQSLYEALKPLRRAEEEGKAQIRTEIEVEAEAIKGLLQRLVDLLSSLASAFGG